jgi:hypothetical protein
MKLPLLSGQAENEAESRMVKSTLKVPFQSHSRKTAIWSCAASGWWIACQMHSPMRHGRVGLGVSSPKRLDLLKIERDYLQDLIYCLQRIGSKLLSPPIVSMMIAEDTIKAFKHPNNILNIMSSNISYFLLVSSASVSKTTCSQNTSDIIVNLSNVNSRKSRVLTLGNKTSTKQ